MLVLKFLSGREMYGYQIISELADLSDRRFVLKEGTLYPILYRLEDDGQIESHWSEAEGKRVARKYYAVIAEGMRTLSEIRTLWKEISSTVERIMED